MVYYYSKKSSEKVFHLPHCKILHRIRKENKMKFETAEEARMAGYRMCNCCSPVGGKLRKEQKDVDRFCQEYGVSCYLEDGQLHVHTPRSEWRIIVNGKINKLFLYHKNTYNKHERIPSIVPGFHSQAIRSKTIVGYLDYIVQHDAYRRREEKKAKMRSDSMKNLRRNTAPYQRGLEKRRYNANQLYSVMKDIYL